MTEPHFKISLSELHQKKRVSGMVGGGRIFDFCLFELRYRVIQGLPCYDLRFPEESIQDITSNNAVDIIEALNEYYSVVLVP